MDTPKNTSGQTNYFALTLMVLFVLFLLITVTGDDATSSPSADPADTVAAATSTTLTPTGSSTNPYMPAGIPVDETAMVENRMISRGSGEATQQIISFRSSLPAAEIAAEYQRWMTENNYTLQRERLGNLAASLTALNGQRGMVITISHLSNLDLRHVEIVNYQRTDS